MEDRNDFRDIVKARFFVFDEKQKKTDIVYLYKDNSNNKGKPAFYNNLSTICDTRLILEETKKIAHECINKYLKIYNNIEPMIVDFDKIFFGETEIRK